MGPLTPRSSTENIDHVISPPAISLPTAPPTPREDESPPNKRQRTLGKLQVSKEKITASLPIEASTTRQLQPKSRGFPQRKKKDEDVHQLQPASIEKFINGIWKQIYSSVELDSTPDPDSVETSSLRTRGPDIDVSA